MAFSNPAVQASLFAMRGSSRGSFLLINFIVRALSREHSCEQHLSEYVE